MKRGVLHLLLLLTAIPMAYADPGAIDPCSGPEVTIDGLEANMPPIYDQHLLIRKLFQESRERPWPE